MVKRYLITFYCFFNLTNLLAQSNVLDDIEILDNLRYNQLMGDTSINNSFINRSTFILQHFQKNKSSLKFNYSNIYNNNLPLARNLGSFFPARGNQTRFNLSTRFLFKFIDININPEFLNTQNLKQIDFNGNLEDGNWWPRYYLMVANNINDYRYFGTNQIKMTTLGQSRFGININNISFGFSNENIWWGPGIRNSLIFSNNAAGFKHLYLRNTNPIKTNLGTFQFHLLRGNIDSTNFANEDDNIMKQIWKDGIFNKIDKGRYLHALNFIWNPIFAKNLYLGYSIANQFPINSINLNGIKYNYFSKDKPEILIKSLQFRYLLPKDNSEIYLEFGNQNNSKIFSDTSNLAFVIGARKIFRVTKNINYEIFIECTQLSLMNPKMIFTDNDPFGQPKINSWYTSSKVRQGWTNQGKLLGASIGPGSNSQLIGLNIYNKNNKFSFFTERVIYNTDFYHYVYLGRLGYSTADAYYVDLSWGLNLFITLNKNISFSTSYISTQSLNYRWFKNGNWLNYAEPGFNSDRSNYQLNFSLMYKINEFN